MQKKREPTIRLVAREGPTSIYIDAGINSEGDLVISGQDIGKALEGLFGDSDYEYWLTVPSSQKDKLLALLGEALQWSSKANLSEIERDALLLELIEKAYKGDVDVVTNLRALLSKHGVPYSFSSY